MKVWCVIEGYDYEGENFNSLRVFSTREKAEDWKQTRSEKMYLHSTKYYIELEEREVDPE